MLSLNVHEWVLQNHLIINVLIVWLTTILANIKELKLILYPVIVATILLKYLTLSDFSSHLICYWKKNKLNLRMFRIWLIAADSFLVDQLISWINNNFSSTLKHRFSKFFITRLIHILHMHSHIPMHTWTKTNACQLDVHYFSLVIFGNLVPQTDSTHNPCGQLAIPLSACVCVRVCECVFTQRAAAAVSVIAL